MRSAPMRLVLLAACLLTIRCDEEYEFWAACEAGDTAAMSELLETAPDIDLDYPDEDGRTPLLLAALHDRAAAARFLLARGADAEAVGRWPGPPDGPLATAAALGHVATMDALLEGGASANAATGPDGRTPLIAAAEAGSLDAVALLLSVGAVVDSKRADGATAACAAAAGGHGDVLRRLLDAGADVHVADTLSGESLLHYAARAPTADAVEVALAAGADFGIRSGVGVPIGEEREEPRREDLRGGLTPLMAAAASSSHEALEVLLAAAKRALGSDFPSYVDAVDASGRTALAWAAAAPVRSTACIELLYASDARDDSATVDGLSVLHLASQGNARAVAYFVDVKSFDVDQRTLTRAGSTPLMLASKAGAVSAAKALIRRGADIDAAAADGATSLHAAAAAGQTAVARLLLKRGANPLAQAAKGEFPSQSCPKTPRGRALKYSLSRAERRAWVRLEREFGGAEPPDAVAEDGVDSSVVEDLEDDSVDLDERDEL
jgi:ankyrin repeat protein